jgi:hypothetical protein
VHANVRGGVLPAGRDADSVRQALAATRLEAQLLLFLERLGAIGS